MRHTTHEVDFCVIGGGLAGMCAAISAARHGAKVVLMQDRPALGGNASSECRVQISGAARGGSIPHVRETGQSSKGVEKPLPYAIPALAAAVVAMLVA